MNIQLRITKLEQATDTTNEVPAFIYFTSGTSEQTADKEKAFLKYREHWRGDKRYRQKMNSLKTVEELEAYCKANKLPDNTITNVVFIGDCTPKLATV